MQQLTHRLLHNWNWIRILRLLIGISILVSGLQAANWVIAGLGFFLTTQGVFDWGCGAGCRGADCAVGEQNIAYSQKDGHDPEHD